MDKYNFQAVEIKGLTLHFSTTDVHYAKVIRLPKDERFEPLHSIKETRAYKRCREEHKEPTIYFRLLGSHGKVIDKGNEWMLYGDNTLIKSFLSPFMQSRDDWEVILPTIQDV